MYQRIAFSPLLVLIYFSDVSAAEPPWPGPAGSIFLYEATFVGHGYHDLDKVTVFHERLVGLFNIVRNQDNITVQEFSTVSFSSDYLGFEVDPGQAGLGGLDWNVSRPLGLVPPKWIDNWEHSFTTPSHLLPFELFSSPSLKRPDAENAHEPAIAESKTVRHSPDLKGKWAYTVDVSNKGDNTIVIDGPFTTRDDDGSAVVCGTMRRIVIQGDGLIESSGQSIAVLQPEIFVEPLAEDAKAVNAGKGLVKNVQKWRRLREVVVHSRFRLVRYRSDKDPGISLPRNLRDKLEDLRK